MVPDDLFQLQHSIVAKTRTWSGDPDGADDRTVMPENRGSDAADSDAEFFIIKGNLPGADRGEMAPECSRVCQRPAGKRFDRLFVEKALSIPFGAESEENLAESGTMKWCNCADWDINVSAMAGKFLIDIESAVAGSNGEMRAFVDLLGKSNQGIPGNGAQVQTP